VENKETGEKVHDGLSANLYQFQSYFQELLPDLHLQAGEVKKINPSPIGGTATTDIYEGLYLGREKVAIKAIRSVKFDDQSKRVIPLLFSRVSTIYIDELVHVSRGSREKRRYGAKCGNAIEENISCHFTDFASLKGPSREHTNV